jgi:hypothetical protein
MNFYNLDTIKNINIDYPDIYFTPEYGKACEYSDNAIWELCKFKDLIYVYLKQPIEYNNKTYYDLITPYGYSGYYYENKETYDEFLPLFRKKALERNYLTEVIRQNPYINIELSNYSIITSKIIYGINIDNYIDYLKKVLNTKKRNMITKANKNNLIFELHNINNLNIFEKFKELYFKNMKRVNSSKYYFFNEKYFNSLSKINNTKIGIIKNNNSEIIGSTIIFIFNNFIHYHLSCNDKSFNCITDFLLTNIVKELCINKLFILGCGLKDEDSLSKFKKKLSNKEFNYIIYKNILNKEIYDKLSKNIETNDFFPIYRY